MAMTAEQFKDYIKTIIADLNGILDAMSDGEAKEKLRGIISDLKTAI